MSQQLNLKELGSIVLSSCSVRAVIHVPGMTNNSSPASSYDNGDLVWVATDDKRILLYAAADPDKAAEVGRISLAVTPVSMVYHCGKVRAKY